MRKQMGGSMTQNNLKKRKIMISKIQWVSQTSETQVNITEEYMI